MPITKIPVVHKFGIISHNQRLELQQRLIRKTYDESHPSNRSIAESKRNPLEVSDAFVKAFNEAATYAEKQKFEGTAEVMLERLKRKAGVRNGGTSAIAELDSAWTDLAALLQCHGRIQEEALDVLIATLDQAPLEPSLVPGIFFLAETVLYWLRTEAMQSPYLRTWEIKLLKIGHVVFMRLYYYHMVGYLQSCRPFKNRLYAYLQGLPGYQSIYSSYPNAHLFLRYIIEVGNILLSDDDLDPGDVKESDTGSQLKNSGKVAGATLTSADSATALAATAVAPGLATQTDSERDHDVLITLSHSVHDLAPTLWHSLDVWRCCQQCADEVGTALKAVLKCGSGLHLESWIDTGCALIVLGEAAKLKMDVLKALQWLAQGHDQAIKPASAAPIDEQQKTPRHDAPVHCPDDSHRDDAEVDELAITARASARSHADDTAMQPSLGTNTVELEQRMDDLTPVTYANSPAPTLRSNGGLPSWRWEVSCIYSEILCSIVLHGATSSIQKKALMGNHTHVDTLRLHDTLHESAGLVDLLVFNPPACRELLLKGELFGPNEQVLSGRGQASSAAAELLEKHDRESGHDELVTLTADKRDLAPRQPQVTIPQSSESGTQPLPASDKQLHDDDADDWTWRIRYSAVQSLVHICQCLRDDEVRSGLRQAAFASLLRAQNYFERDSRVLEALKVGQASAKIEDTLQGKTNHATSPARKLVNEKSGAAMKTAAGSKDVTGMSTVGAKIAEALAERYLPPLQQSSRRQLPVSVRSPTSSLPSARQQRPQQEANGPKITAKKPAAPLRTTIKEELTFSTSGGAHLDIPDFNTRTSMDLRRIVEDQWRKELHQQLQEEEAERLRQVEENRSKAKSKSKEQSDKQQPRSTAAAVAAGADTASDVPLAVPAATASVGTT